MREIKFRAWEDTNKVMVYFDPMRLVKDQYQALALLTLLATNSPFVMQYTGLKDKNGEDIYEGDVASDGLVFEYNVEMGGWYRMKNGEGVQWHEQAVKKGCLPFEIIGNIYENPELLK